MKTPDPIAAAHEFDLWADAGRAESMADGHRGVTSCDKEQLDHNATVLDVGCAMDGPSKILSIGVLARVSTFPSA